MRFRDLDIKFSFIYFIQGVDGGPVKIGRSVDVERRLAEMQKDSPVRLVVRETLRGGAADEHRLQKQFTANRIHGEWFEPHPDMPGVIYRGRKMYSTATRRNKGKAFLNWVEHELLATTQEDVKVPAQMAILHGAVPG
jgi:hypothetical protein